MVMGPSRTARGALTLAGNALGVGDNPDFRLNNERVRRLEEMQRAGGHEGADVAGFIGGLADPAWLKAGKMLSTSGSLPKRMAIGGGIGGVAGATTPVTSEDYWGTVGANTAGGTAIGAGIPAAMALAKTIGGVGYNVAEPFIPGQSKQIKGREYIDAAIGKSQQLAQALRNPQQIVQGSLPSAGEAGAGVGATKFSAMQEAARGVRPDEYAARADVNNAARLRTIEGVAQTPEALKAAQLLREQNAAQRYGAVRNDLINPKSDAQIMADSITAKAHEKDVAGKFGAHLDLDEAELASSTFGKQEDFLRKFTDSLKMAGDLDTTSLDKFLARPSVQDAIKNTMKGAKETGEYFPGKGEQFSVGNLQRIKAAISDVISDPKNVQGLQATERKEIGDTLSSFVDWLSNKSPGWKAARVGYIEDSVPINQMKGGQYLRDTLTNTPKPYQQNAGGMPLNENAFLQALRKSTDVSDTNAAKRAAELIVKRSTNQPRGELPEIMGTKMEPLNQVRDDILRKQAMESQAKAGQQAAPNIMEIATRSMESKVGKPPGILDRAVMLSRAILNRMEGKANVKLANEMAADMLVPQTVASHMSAAIARQERAKKIAELINKMQPSMTGSAVQTIQGSQP